MSRGVSLILSIVIPAAVVLASIIVAMLMKRVLLAKIARAAKETKWRGDDIIIRSLRGMIVPSFFVLGLYIALQISPLPAQISQLLDKVILVLLIVLVSTFMAKLAGGFVDLYGEKVKEALPTATIFKNFTKILILSIGVLVILQTLGISITPLLTALGVGGLAVALALQDTLSNFFSGIHILLTRQVKVGDYVRLETGEEGYVIDITWRNTTIRALPNNIIIVPNSKLASAVIVNYYLPQREMAVLVQVGVSYDSDLEKVERVTVEVAKEVMREVEGGVPEFEPFIRYHTFADFSINFTVILRAREFVGQYLIKHEFIKRLHKRYQQEGIEIPFPIRTVYMKDEGAQ